MKIKVNMTAKDLFGFSMYNSYSGFAGAFNLIFTVGALAILVYTRNWDSVSTFQRVLLVCCALIFTAVQPAMLYFKSQKHAKQEGFDTDINLTLTDKRFLAERAGVNAEFEWNQIWKVIRTKSMYIVKVGPTRAYLIPLRSIEGREKELAGIFKKSLPASKMKGLKA